MGCIFYGSMNPQLASKTGFSDEDAQAIKDALRTLFVNDASSARPEGSMEVYKVYWWEHNSPNGQYSSAKVHRLLKVEPASDDPKSIEDYDIALADLPDLKCEVIGRVFGGHSPSITSHLRSGKSANAMS